MALDPSSTGSTGSASATPDFILQALRTIYGQGASIAGEGYQPYGEARLASLTPDQLASGDLLRGLAMSAYPDEASISSAMSRGLAGFDENELQRYLNPYVGGVVDELARLNNKNLFENVLPQINSTFVGNNTFGGTRSADFTNRAIDANQRTLLGAQTSALSDAYKTAMDDYRNWTTGGLTAATQALTAGTNTAKNLFDYGATEQGLQQKGLDLQYQDFLQQRDYPKTQLEWLSNIIRGNQAPSATAQYSNTGSIGYSPGPLSQIAQISGAVSNIVR